jgi:hypothetical protein
MKSNGTFSWQGTASDPIAETGANDITMNEYLFFGGKRIARQEASNNMSY